MAKMLVTQALDERDLLVKKIGDKIEKASFVDMMRKNEENVVSARITKKEFEKQAKSSLQQVMDLIDRFQKIEAAIVASNASTYIETSYGKFTVAGGIALRSRLQAMGTYAESGDFENMLCEKMESEYHRFVSAAEEKNKRLQETAEGMRLSILGKDSKTKEDRPLEVVDAYIRENTTDVIDPLGVKERVEKIREKNNTLLTELNTQIKVSNATTVIEV